MIETENQELEENLKNAQLELDGQLKEKSYKLAGRICIIYSELYREADSFENPRVKAMIKTKLQEAELLCSKLYDKNF